jgi:hypothetical protein
MYFVLATSQSLSSLLVPYSLSVTISLFNPYTHSSCDEGVLTLERIYRTSLHKSDKDRAQSRELVGGRLRKGGET